MTISELRSRIRSSDKLRNVLEEVLDDIDAHTTSVQQLGTDAPHVQNVLEFFADFREHVLQTLDNSVEELCESHAQLSTIYRGG